MLRKTNLPIGLFVLLAMAWPAFGGRDWEYWSRYSFEVPLNEGVSYLIKPEWRIKNDMTDKYLFKLEQAIAFKVNKFFEVAPYYVWQESKTARGDDKSDLFYLDVTAKITAEKLYGVKITDRLRYQYNFDKSLTVWRNSLRLAKAIKLGEWELSPFIEDETFYDTRQNQLNENWASAGVSLALNKNSNVAISYLLDSKKRGDDWVSANVLVTSFILKF